MPPLFPSIRGPLISEARESGNSGVLRHSRWRPPALTTGRTPGGPMFRLISIVNCVTCDLWACGQRSRGKERLTRCCSPRARARPLCSRKVPCTAPVAPAHCDSPSMPPVQFSMPPPLNGHPQLTRASTPLCAVSRRSWGRWSSRDQVRIRGGVKDKVRAARMPRAHASIPALCPRYFSTRPHTSRKPPLSCSVPPTLTRCRSRRRRFGARFKRDSN